ncbi:bifunctional RNase H/acid phosphatase [Streptomyces sp. RP5T]|uniref:bifunctional RNase H/acid phosphatase n=1 Tax=Streptomyces sp. RP5T TaxID=2490848 RepID=UPI000F650178|nr:bifunctional RNase H/acid phosphatase [Streptomyces sp. RP5T]RRR74878.1 bifunctional RNase H/acid phosphatase [Streptomyces sp. RP5T]
MREFIVEADGGSRGNPGPAGYGSVVLDAATGETLVETYEYLGIVTNNVAEYRGLLAGLRAAHDLDPSARVHVRMDSKLVVEQMSGRWKIKHPDMKPLALEAGRIFPPGRVTYEWIPREQNKHADRLANEAMDSGASASSVRKLSPAAETPTADAGRLSAAAGKRSAAAETSAPAGGKPSTAVGRLSVPAETPTASAETPTASAETPTASAETPTAAAGKPSAAAGKPTAAAETSAPAGGKPSTAVGRLSVPGETPTASAGKPTAAAGKRSAAAGKPTASAGKLSAAAGKPSAAAETSAPPAEKPTTSAGRLSAAGAQADVRAAKAVASPGWAPADMGAPATFVLLRHGETPLTPQKRFSGSGGTDPSLSEIGREQARRAAEALAARGTIQHILASPLARTRETAAAVADRLGIEVTVEDGLIETDFGAWEGLTFGEVRERYPDDLTKWLADPEAEPTGGGESFAATATRIAATRDRLVAAYAGRTVLLVTHVTPIKTFVRLALGAPPESLFRMELSAASMSVVAYYADGNASVRLLNDTSYLRP